MFKRRHEITVNYRTDRLGGQILAATHTLHSEPYLRIVEWTKQQRRKHGVDIHFGSTVTADALLSQPAHAIIIAAGAAGSKPVAARGHDVEREKNAF